MNDEHILYAVSNGVATITLNRPDKLNALTPYMLGDIFLRVRDASADEAVRAVLLTGAGRAFCAGLDLNVIGTGTSSGGVPTEPSALPPQWGDDIGPNLERFYATGWRDFIVSRKPIIAAINGPIFGWGFILALHCDIRFAAKSALFNATFARLGIPAEKNAGWLLTRLIGPARAADLLFTARRFDGAEAMDMGVVNSVFADDELQAHTVAYAENIAKNSAPRSLAAIKSQIWTAIDDPYNEAFEASDQEQDAVTETDDFKEALSSYKAKRSPVFTGR